MRLSPEIKPKAKLEAHKLAFDWKAKMIAETENYLAILGFLLLVGAYGLASSFDKYELESLCHTVAQDENAYQNFHVLGIAGNTSHKNSYVVSLVWHIYYCGILMTSCVLFYLLRRKSPD